MKKTKYLIVGGGPGGFAAVESIRKKDPQGSILIVDNQGEGLYSKIVLHKFLEGKMDESALKLKKDQWFIDNKVEQLTAEIVSILCDENKVFTSDNQEIVYEKILISSGGSPRKLSIEGENLDGVRNFYSLADARTIKNDLIDVKEVVVVGGGFLTVDLLDSLSAMSKKVTVIIRSDRLLKEKIGPKGSKIIEDKLREEGVDFRFSANVRRFEGEEKLSGVTLDTGEKINCQLVIVAIGIVPNIGFLTNSAVKTDKGIIIDKSAQTSVKNVFACGDCCQIKSDLTGEDFLPGNWFFALVSGKVAGANMAGGSEVLDETPQVTKIVAGLTLGFVGMIGEQYMDLEYEKDGRYLQFYKKNQTTIGISSINLSDKISKMKEAIGKDTIFGL